MRGSRPPDSYPDHVVSARPGRAERGGEFTLSSEGCVCGNPSGAPPGLADGFVQEGRQCLGNGPVLTGWLS